MIENLNPSFESLVKKLYEIYQQINANNISIDRKQPDLNKILLENNWLQSIAIIDDTRTNDTDIPVVPINYTTIVPDIVPFIVSYIPIVYNLSSGLMPMTVSYNYQRILPNITKELIPFLEYETSFSAPNGNMKLSTGFLWNIDTWVDMYKVVANGTIVWEGIDPPFANNIEISQYQVDNNYTSFYQQSWHLSFTSPEGGVYGHGSLVGCILLSVIDETSDTVIPITDALFDPDTGVFIPPVVGHSYQFSTWFNQYQLPFTLEYSFMNSSSVIIREEVGAYIALWPDNKNPFYIYDAVPLIATIDYSTGSTTDLTAGADVITSIFDNESSDTFTVPVFPDTVTGTATNGPIHDDGVGNIYDTYFVLIIPTGSNQDWSPITFTINADGPIKYSSIVQQSLQTYVHSSVHNDPFYIRQSKSTDKKESWQANANFGAIVTSQGIQTIGIDLPQYNDIYTGSTPPAGLTTWTPMYNHTTVQGDQYYPITNDMTTRVVVAMRPPINWHKIDKFQPNVGGQNDI